MALFPWIKAAKAPPAGPLMPETEVVVVGDIHGCADLLEQILAQITEAAPPTAHLVCVGDYVDRGEDSAEVLRAIQALQRAAPEGQVVCLMGNHEKMLLDFCEAPEEFGPRWTRHGGAQTLASFDVAMGPPEGRDWQVLRDALRAAMGADLEDWLRALPTIWQSGNLVVTHAGADPHVPIDEQAVQGLLWGGAGFYDTPRRDGIWVAHGHVIVEVPKAAKGRIAVDTGAYATGRLTAAVIAPEMEAADIVFLQTSDAVL